MKYEPLVASEIRAKLRDLRRRMFGGGADTPATPPTPSPIPTYTPSREEKLIGGIFQSQQAAAVAMDALANQPDAMRKAMAQMQAQARTYPFGQHVLSQAGSAASQDYGLYSQAMDPAHYAPPQEPLANIQRAISELKPSPCHWRLEPCLGASKLHVPFLQYLCNSCGREEEFHVTAAMLEALSIPANDSLIPMIPRLAKVLATRSGWMDLSIVAAKRADDLTAPIVPPPEGEYWGDYAHVVSRSLCPTCAAPWVAMLALDEAS